jgi:hypothetical protein
MQERVHCKPPAFPFHNEASLSSWRIQRGTEPRRQVPAGPRVVCFSAAVAAAADREHQCSASSVSAVSLSPASDSQRRLGERP